MINALKNLMLSRKFWMTVTGTIVVTVMNQVGLDNGVVAAVAGLFGVNIAGIAYEGQKK